jgi:chromosome partitioning protein
LPIMLYDDKCKGAEAYEDLSKEFLKRQKEWNLDWIKNLD